MQYRVIETQDYTEPLEKWATAATFEAEAEALEFLDLHYKTQVFTNGLDYDPATDCGCETCSGGWRPIDRMALVVQVVEVN